MSKVAAIILAAGKGTRIKNKNGGNKVALEVDGRPMIVYTVDTLHNTHVNQIILVVGYAQESILKIFGDSVDYAQQAEQLGTGHAVECGLKKLHQDIEYVLVLNGDDSAFFPAYILNRLIDTCQNHPCAFSILTLQKNNPFALGRIIRDDQDKLIGIIEEKNATQEQKMIKEVNLNAFCFNRKFIDQNIGKIKFNEISNERYITDIVQIAVDTHQPIIPIMLQTEDFWHGVNTDEDLENANKKMAGTM